MLSRRPGSAHRPDRRDPAWTAPSRGFQGERVKALVRGVVPHHPADFPRVRGPRGAAAQLLLRTDVQRRGEVVVRAGGDHQRRVGDIPGFDLRRMEVDGQVRSGARYRDGAVAVEDGQPRPCRAVPRDASSGDDRAGGGEGQGHGADHYEHAAPGRPSRPGRAAPIRLRRGRHRRPGKRRHGKRAPGSWDPGSWASGSWDPGSGARAGGATGAAAVRGPHTRLRWIPRPGPGPPAGGRRGPAAGPTEWRSFRYPVGLSPAGAAAQRPGHRPPSGRIPHHAVADVQVSEAGRPQQPDAVAALPEPVHGAEGQRGTEGQGVGPHGPPAERVMAVDRARHAISQEERERHRQQRGDEQDHWAGQLIEDVGARPGTRRRTSGISFQD